jgi:hypothetical protein
VSRRNKKPRKVPLTLEQQVEALGRRPRCAFGPAANVWLMAEPWMEPHIAIVASAQFAWDRERARLSAEIRARDAVAVVDPGRDVTGNYNVSPFISRYHKVENAPQDLAKSPDSKFPKRIATQRMIDRYKVRSQITIPQWRAANALWEHWNDLGLEHRMTSGYEPSSGSGAPSKDGLIARRVDATAWWNAAMEVIPYRSRGVVRAVVIEDISASAWARGRGYGLRDSERLGLTRLRPGLQALVEHLNY